jgi:hypothetical protein
LKEKQFQECTFSPSINYSTKSAGSIERFEVWEQTRRATLLKKINDKAGMELEGCTFWPEVASKRPECDESSVFEHLYNVRASQTHLSRQRMKRQQEADRRAQEDKQRSPRKTSSITSPRSPIELPGRMIALGLSSRETISRFDVSLGGELRRLRNGRDSKHSQLFP